MLVADALVLSFVSLSIELISFNGFAVDRLALSFVWPSIEVTGFIVQDAVLGLRRHVVRIVTFFPNIVIVIVVIVVIVAIVVDKF